MPTFVHGKNTRVLYDDYDLSEYFNAADTSEDLEPADATTFSSTRTRKAYISGMEDATASLSGLWSGDADGVDDVLQAAIANAEATSALMIARHELVIGRLAEFFICRETSYTVSSPVGDVVSISLAAQSTSGVDTGVVLADPAVRTATADLAAVNQSITTNKGGAGQLHVLSNDRDGATDVIVQHSADGLSWVDLLTFTSVAASTTAVERIDLPATTEVLDRLRVRIELAGTTGDVSIVAAFARNY